MEIIVEENLKKTEKCEDTKKLSFVIFFLSLTVVVLFGLAPFV